MELKQYFILFGRWFWLLFLALFLGAASGILISRNQTPVYQATAKILVMRAPDTSASGLAYMGEQQLATTFDALITTQPIFDTVSGQLGYKVTSDHITVQQDTNSAIINVTAEDSDPERTAKIANSVVDAAIKRYVDLQVGQYTDIENDVRTQLNLLQSRMDDLQSQIDSTSETIINSQEDQILAQMNPLQDEVSQLQKDIAELTPATTLDQKTQLAEKQARLDQIRPLLSSYQTAFSNLIVLNKPLGTGSADENSLILLQNQWSTYSQDYVDLTSKLEELSQHYVKGISNVTRIQAASIPTRPVRPQILVNTLLTSAVGLALAIIAIFLMENLGINLGSRRKKLEQPGSAQDEKLNYPASK
jgi:capsular polysaccharide biosynthesis protein